MRLSELKPEFMPEGVTTVDAADTLWFDCPGCKGTEREHRLRMPFAQKHPNGTAWTVQGTSFEDLSFVDDPRGSRSLRVLGYPCHSHFNITQGAIEFYGDSHALALKSLSDAAKALILGYRSLRLLETACGNSLF